MTVVQFPPPPPTSKNATQLYRVAFLLVASKLVLNPRPVRTGGEDGVSQSTGFAPSERVAPTGATAPCKGNPPPPHQLKIPTNSPVGISLLIAACSRASARAHADFGFSCRPVFQHHSAVSRPLFSAPSRRPRGRSPQAQNSYFYLFNELRAALLTRFLRSIGPRWMRSALRHRMAAMLRSAVNPYRRPRGTRPVAVG